MSSEDKTSEKVKGALAGAYFTPAVAGTVGAAIAGPVGFVVGGVAGIAIGAIGGWLLGGKD